MCLFFLFVATEQLSPSIFVKILPFLSPPPYLLGDKQDSGSWKSDPDPKWTGSMMKKEEDLVRTRICDLHASLCNATD